MTRDSEWIRRLALTEHVTSDLACCHCGYNLKTLRRDGKCPECGVPVADSLMGDRLEYRNPAWLDGLAEGLRTMYRAACAQVWCLIVALFGGMCEPLAMFILAGAGLGAILAAIWLGVGLWRFTIPEPRAAGTGPTMPAQLVARACLVTAVLGIPAGIILWRYSAAVGEILVDVGMLAGLTCAVAILVLFRELALRIPDEKMGAAAKKNVVAAVVLGGAMLAVRVMLVLVTTPWGALAVLAAVCLAAFFTVRCMLLLERMRLAVDEAVARAFARREADRKEGNGRNA